MVPEDLGYAEDQVQMTDMDYPEFLHNKSQLGGDHGFEPLWMPNFLYPFQTHLTEYGIRKGRFLWLEDCGLGKTPQSLVWCQNVVQHTNKNMIIAAPLAVSHQFIREGEKFGVEVKRSTDGQPKGRITITNYEQLHKFDPNDFVGMLADESGCIKNFDGVIRKTVTEFMRRLPFRGLASATSAPNDFVELGTHSEALGELGYMDMLGRYFKNDNNTCDAKRRKHAKLGAAESQWRFRGHAEEWFWRWVASWARAVRKPSDLGFDDGDFILPELIERQHIIGNLFIPDGELLPREARGIREQNDEIKRTYKDRCEKAAELIVGHSGQSVVWCNRIEEGRLLEKLIPNCVQVSGSDSDEKKEEKLKAFMDGEAENLVTKSKIAGFGLNMQFCNHTVYLPDNSHEKYYQAIRRFWRFGQTRPVTVDVVTTKGGKSVLKNLQRKADQCKKMFDSLIGHMNGAVSVDNARYFEEKMEVPSWLKTDG